MAASECRIILLIGLIVTEIGTKVAEGMNAVPIRGGSNDALSGAGGNVPAGDRKGVQVTCLKVKPRVAA